MYAYSAIFPSEYSSISCYTYFLYDYKENSIVKWKYKPFFGLINVSFSSQHLLYQYIIHTWFIHPKWFLTIKVTGLFKAMCLPGLQCVLHLLSYPLMVNSYLQLCSCHSHVITIWSISDIILDYGNTGDVWYSTLTHLPGGRWFFDQKCSYLINVLGLLVTTDLEMTLKWPQGHKRLMMLNKTCIDLCWKNISFMSQTSDVKW